MSEPPIGFDPPQQPGQPNPPQPPGQPQQPGQPSGAGGWGPPPPGQPYQVPPQPPRGGSLWLGLGIAVGSMALVWFGTTALSSTGAGAFWLLFAWPFVLLVTGLVLAGIPKTSRTGGGILLGLGAGILILGGICIAMLAGA